MNYARRAIWILLLVEYPCCPSRIRASGRALAGEWRFGQRVVVFEQDGAKIRGLWKDQYRDKNSVCTDVWFTGEVEGNAVRGVRYLCPRNTRQPLNITIIDPNTLEIIASSKGTDRTGTLRRIPAAR